MNRDLFRSNIKKIYTYFRYDKLPTQEQIDLWFESLSYIPDSSLNDIFKNLQQNENLPRNLPRAFKEAYQMSPKNINYERYDKYDDPQYPIENLWQALRVYIRQGQDGFMQYCRSVRMPLQDIERVQNKYRHAFARKDAGVLTHKELKRLQQNKEPIRIPWNDDNKLME